MTPSTLTAWSKKVIKHFDTLADAIQSLTQYRFKEIRPGWWANLPDRVRATIHPKAGSEVVAVCYSHIEI